MTFKRVSYHFGSAAVTSIASTDDRKVNAGSTPPNTTMVLHSAPQGQHHTQLTYRQRLTQLHALCVQAVPARLYSLIARASCTLVSVLALGLDIRCSTPSQPVCCLHSLSLLLVNTARLWLQLSSCPKTCMPVYMSAAGPMRGEPSATPTSQLVAHLLSNATAQHSSCLIRYLATDE